MFQFIENKINERQLMELTQVNGIYEAIYLCSAMVLPEYRNKGIAKRLTLEAIASICENHAIKSLFVWSFSEGGARLAHSIAKAAGLPLLEKAGVGLDRN